MQLIQKKKKKKQIEQLPRARFSPSSRNEKIAAPPVSTAVDETREGKGNGRKKMAIYPSDTTSRRCFVFGVFAGRTFK